MILRNRLDQLVEDHVPTCSFKPRKSDWMTGDILREIRRKRRQWKKAKAGRAEDREEYEATAKKVKNMIRNAKKSLEKKLVTEKYYNSNPFYNYIKKISTTKSAIGPLINEQGDMVIEEEETAEKAVKKVARKESSEPALSEVSPAETTGKVSAGPCLHQDV